MGYRKVSEPEDIGLYRTYREEAVPLTNSTPSAAEKEHTLTDKVPVHLEPYLQTKPTFGLTDEQVLERRSRFGRNELMEKKRNKLLHFLSFCKSKGQRTGQRVTCVLC